MASGNASRSASHRVDVTSEIQASSLGFGDTWRGRPADLLLVADFLGHSSLSTLKIYIQPNSIGPHPHAQIRETRSLQSIFESRPKPRSTSGPPGR
jgi:hypothetical protein